MTETHSLGEWEKVFDEKWTLYMGSYSSNKETFFKPFICALLLAQKEGFRREIEELRVKEREFVITWLKQISQDLSEDSFDRIVSQFEMLLAKLDTNGI